jgi:hypothetical protein
MISVFGSVYKKINLRKNTNIGTCDRTNFRKKFVKFYNYYGVE